MIFEFNLVNLWILKIISFNNIIEKSLLKGLSIETKLFQDSSSVAGWLTATFLKKILRNVNQRARHGRARKYNFNIISFNVIFTLKRNYFQ